MRYILIAMLLAGCGPATNPSVGDDVDPSTTLSGCLAHVDEQDMELLLIRSKLRQMTIQFRSVIDRRGVVDEQEWLELEDLIDAE